MSLLSKKLTKINTLFKQSMFYIQYGELQNSLLTSIKQNNIEKIKYLVNDLNVPVNTIFEQKYKTKRESYPDENGNFKFIKIPLPETINKNKSPIILSLYQNNKEIFEFLLSKNGKLNNKEVEKLIEIKYFNPSEIDKDKNVLYTFKQIFRNSESKSRTINLFLNSKLGKDIFNDKNKNNEHKTIRKKLQKEFLNEISYNYNLNIKDIENIIKTLSDKNISKSYCMAKAESLIKEKEKITLDEVMDLLATFN